MPGGGECSVNDAGQKLYGGPPSPCTLPVPGDFPFAPAGALPTACPAGITLFQPIGPADIYPAAFKRNPIAQTCSEWQALAYVPNPDLFAAMFDYGRRDAELWAQQEGLAP